MAIPLSYNLRSLKVRWSSTVVALLGIAGTVGVFVAMLALATGHHGRVRFGKQCVDPPCRRHL